MVLKFMHSQTSPTLGMGNISLLECLWPPLFERRLNRVIQAEIEAEREQEDKEPDEGILGQRKE